MAQVAHNLDEKTRSEDVKIIENVTFESMLFPDELYEGLKINGFVSPSPIQLKAIPLGRCGFDLIIKAKSGTGKTIVFGTVALERIDVEKKRLQALILAPTREIAVQIQDVLRAVGCKIAAFANVVTSKRLLQPTIKNSIQKPTAKILTLTYQPDTSPAFRPAFKVESKTKPINILIGSGLSVQSFIGGLPVEEDLPKLKNCHIAVGAPGRVKHLVEKGSMNLDDVKLFVLDEADKLMETSFQNDINTIFYKLPERKQMMSVSATYPNNLEEFLARYMNSPIHVSPGKEAPLLLGIKQFVSMVKSHPTLMQQLKIKTEELLRILTSLSFNQCLIFTNYQSRAESLSNNLTQRGWPSLSLSSQQSQVKRLNAIKNLKDFSARILVTTDLAARGIDASNVDLTINYEVPYDTATYLHRMGRAGRYGSQGLCISIVSAAQEADKFRKVIGGIGSSISVPILPKTDASLSQLWNEDLKNCEHIFGLANEVKEEEKRNNVKAEMDQPMETSPTESSVKGEKPVKASKEQPMEVQNDAYSKNVSLLKVSEFLISDNYNISEDLCKSVDYLLKTIKRSDSPPGENPTMKNALEETTSEEQPPEVKPSLEVQPTDFDVENLLKAAFEHAVGLSETHWKNYVSKELLENTVEQSDTDQDAYMSQEYDEEENYYEEEEEEVENTETSDGNPTQDYPFNAWTPVKVVKNRTVGEKLYSSTTWKPSSELKPSNDWKTVQTLPSYFAPEPDIKQLIRQEAKEFVRKQKSNWNISQSEVFQGYFNYYSDLLAANGPYFEDAQSFDAWYEGWKRSVEECRRQVQVKLFTQYMNKNS